jgi:hypothetical protein
MKKAAILIGLLVILASVVAIWAQPEPMNQQPASAFYGTITYSGCTCDQNDSVCIQPDGGKCYYYRIQRCGGNPGYSTMGQSPEKLMQGWYTVTVLVPTHNGCETDYPIHIWHSGMAAQEVNLTVGG